MYMPDQDYFIPPLKKTFQEELLDILDLQSVLKNLHVDYGNKNPHIYSGYEKRWRVWAEVHLIEREIAHKKFNEKG